MGYICDMDPDGTVSDQLEDIRRVVEDAQRRGDPERTDPRLELGCFGVLVVPVQLDDVVGEDTPEGIDDLATQPGAVQEAAYGPESVRLAPDAGTEPGQETRGDQLLQPFP